ncbi:uncharacterized protein TRIADDRAFT_62029 [Trichoplax adhaerens]|uniref:Uncharacterized protein n=1 Tax=Trichoplax adhaerens TaxID=10228 RepID=B3SCM5_TRIAD|nr:hypothetical protein TRIADDRAFT_62029 [Trichoplax adhaerens]EDV19542.1 hypothetical protein TRIADDRAFT_62029 [Trichoplax adhaerens]|eukprot:XP_002117974.1 hypothetical protein TRIADDRAFT_62029 [Trichoplax adhaerens]
MDSSEVILSFSMSLRSVNHNNISGFSPSCSEIFSSIKDSLDISYNNLVSNGINIYKEVLMKLAKLPPTLSIGHNNLSLSAIKEIIRGFYITNYCVSPIGPNDDAKCFIYSIDLSYSKLTEIPSNIFVHLRGFLRVLNLNNNAIKHFDASAIFRDSEKNLQELHLAHNAIAEVTNPNNVQFNALKIICESIFLTRSVLCGIYVGT